MLLIKRGWDPSVLGWKHLICTRDDQCHTSSSLEPQTPAPASFAGKKWGCITSGLSTAPSLRPVKTHVSTRGGGRVSPVHQHVPLPPSLTLGLHLHLLWEREWLEMAVGCLTWIIPVGCFPTTWKTPCS